MALEVIQQKKQVIESRARIREFVFGIQDGLISTVGLLAGIQGATENNVVVIITGLTAMFSGAISMAAGSYLSSGAQKEIFDKELADAERLAAREPYLSGSGRPAQSAGRGGLEQRTELPDGESADPRTKRFPSHLSGESVRSGQRGNQPAALSRSGDGVVVHRWRICSDRSLRCFVRCPGALSFRPTRRHHTLRRRRV